MRMFKKIFCCHTWDIPYFRRTRSGGIFGLATEYEWECNKCGKVEWSQYRDIPKTTSFIK